MLVSAFAFGGVPEKAVKKTFVETELYISLALLKEYREVPLVLERAKKITPHQLKALISGLASIAAKADFLITGDKDLLDMHPLPFQLKIVSPRKFMELTRR